MVGGHSIFGCCSVARGGDGSAGTRDHAKDFWADPLVRIETIAEVCRPQWEASNLTYTDFADLLVGGDSTLLDATVALKVAIADFFRRLGRNELAVVLDRAWETTVKGMALAVEKAGSEKAGRVLSAALERMERDLDQELDRATDRLLGTGSGD